MQKKDNTSHIHGQEQICVGGWRGKGVLIITVKINMLRLIASGNRLKANLKGYMPQLCMLVLCFLSKSLENQCSQHLDTRRWFPQTALDSTSSWGKKKEHATKQRRRGRTGCSRQAQGGSHPLSEEKVYTRLCNKTKQTETPEEDRAAKNMPTGLTDTHCQISFSPFSLIFIPYWSEHVLTQGKAPGEDFPWCESLSLVSALMTPQKARPLGRAKMYVSAFTLSLKHLGF